MAINDEIREQQKKLKGKSFKEKFNYFWDYYKIQTFLIIFAAIVIGSFIWDTVTAKDDAFSACLLNAYGGSLQDDFQDSFAEFAQIDTNAYNCYIDTTSSMNYDMSGETDLAIFQRTLAMIQISSLDVMIADPMPFSRFADNMIFLDLRDILTEEEYARYEPYFYYVDGALADTEYQESDDMDTTGKTVGIQDIGKNPADPSSMEDPIPAGIYLPGCQKLKDFGCYAYTNEDPVLGFVISTERLDTALQFLHYLTE